MNQLTTPFKEHLRERLKTTDDYIGYLNACHKDQPETFALAVQYVLDFVSTAMRDACVEKVKAMKRSTVGLTYDNGGTAHDALVEAIQHRNVILEEVVIELESVRPLGIG